MPSYSYNIIFFLLTYLVPIVAMGICYGQISYVLWGKGISRCALKPQEQIKEPPFQPKRGSGRPKPRQKD